MQQPFSQLIEQYLDDSLSADQRAAFLAAIDSGDHDAELNELLDKTLQENPFRMEEDEKLKELLYRKISQGMYEENTGGEFSLPPAQPYRSTFRQGWLRYAAAAVLLIGAGIYLYTALQKQKITATAINPAPAANIVPGSDRALLTLSDGSIIILDSASDGQVATQGNTQVVKLPNGEIRYQRLQDKPASAGISYNTMATPRGGQYRLRLPDGTQVWLNAASSITYPTAFTGSDRSVAITGEAYFEVTKNTDMPFKVNIKSGKSEEADRQIEALGTHFNVNSYLDEPTVTTTLLEGSVRIGKNILRPGEAYANGAIVKADTEAAIAWKNGYFQFREADIRAVMRQISRWYDVEIAYEGAIPERKFGGDLLRESNLSDLLRGLEISQIHFRIEGKKLIITP